MACALMMAGIGLIVNSIFDFIDETNSEKETTEITETTDVVYLSGGFGTL